MVGTSNKYLISQHKDTTKNPKKHHPHNNKKNKGPKASQLVHLSNCDKGTQSIGKQIERLYFFWEKWSFGV